MTKILITSTSFGKLNPAPLELLASKDYIITTNDLGHPLAGDDLVERLENCQGVIAGVDYFTREVIEQLKGKEAGIVVTNTPEANSDSVADLAVGLMLAAARRIPEADRYVKGGEWQRVFGVSLAEKTVGLLGLGRIGARVAKRVQGFGCRVLVCDPYVKPEYVQEIGAEKVELDELFEQSDFLSLHSPVTDETREMINAARLAQMKSSAILVNTARGELIDQPALIEALKNEEIFAAGLDAYAEEPCDPALFAGINNVVLTPHAGAHTSEALDKMAFGASENLIAVLDGLDPPDRVV